MAFPPREVALLLAQCHRRCSICHRFCGVKMELDHIIPRADNGPDTIENAIPVCFECHAEIHLYNDRHPRGRKFRPEELRAHKEQWLRTCQEQPRALLDSPRASDVGPLQALIDELEFNAVVARACEDAQAATCLFETTQFNRALQEGLVSLLDDELKAAIYETYRQIKSTNSKTSAVEHFSSGSNAWANAWNDARKAIRETSPQLQVALGLLGKFLQSEA